MKTDELMKRLKRDLEEVLEGGDKVRARKVIEERLKEVESYLREGYKDPVTGLFNRRYFEERLEKELIRAKRENYILSVLMFDIDHFKEINDTYGHPGGDYVLKGIAGLLMGEGLIRGSDEVVRCEEENEGSRFGGDEFALLLIKAGEKGAYKVGERIRELVEKSEFKYNGDKIKVTITLGHASWRKGREGVRSGRDLIRAADDNLYEAKERGRNGVYPELK